jgi:polar amino acid transport system substrate-binding protein
MGGATKRAALLGLLAVLGCTSPRSAVTGPRPMQSMLRVGVSPDAPPIVFMRDGRIVGVEPDLAQALSDQSRRPLALIPMEFNALIPALLDGRIDAIMSGMSVTPAREVRVAFADPYMRGGLLPGCRRSDAAKYPTRASILSTGGNVGVRSGSTAESWAQANLPYANVAVYPSIADAARELSQGRLDLIISDAPQVAWAVSEHAGTLQVLRVLLTQEDIAWAFRRDDAALRGAANAALASMRQDGRLHAILQRWIPYLDQLERAR